MIFGPGRVILSLPWRCLDPFPPLGTHTSLTSFLVVTASSRSASHGPVLRAFLFRSLTSFWLHTSFPAQCMARNSSATAHAVSRSWTWLKDVGDDIISVGPQGPRAPQFCMRLPCRIASALQRGRSLSLEEEKLHVFFVPALSATSLTALRAVQLSKKFVCSGVQQYTSRQQKFPPRCSTVGCLDPIHPANTRSAVRAHVRFVKKVCARVFERSTLPS